MGSSAERTFRLYVGRYRWLRLAATGATGRSCGAAAAAAAAARAGFRAWRQRQGALSSFAARPRCERDLAAAARGDGECGTVQ